MVAGGWLLDGAWGAWTRTLGAAIELAILCTWLWVIGMYDKPSRESGTPYVTNPTRRWVRLAFAFLVFSLALDVVLFGREALYGTAPSLTELSAARHALAQGFLLPLMVSMASRLLPIYSADVLRRRALLEVTIDLLLVGALVRVGAEAIGGYAEVYGVPFSFIPCSGAGGDPKPGPIPTRVRALPDRIEREITFPRLVGYRRRPGR